MALNKIDMVEFTKYYKNICRKFILSTVSYIIWKPDIHYIHYHNNCLLLLLPKQFIMIYVLTYKIVSNISSCA